MDLLLLAQAKELGERKQREDSREAPGEASDKLLQQGEEPTLSVWRQTSRRRPNRIWRLFSNVVEGERSYDRIALLFILIVLTVIPLAKLQQCQQTDLPGREAEKKAGWEQNVEPKNEAINR